MPRLTSTSTAWLAILALAIGVRLAAGVWWQARLPAGQKFFFGDSESYWALGKELARGEPYAYPTPEMRVFRTPGYPLLLAALDRTLGDHASVMSARALSAILGGAAAGVAGWWATQLFDTRAGLWAALFVALYPGAVAMGAFVLSDGPFCPFMLLQLALWSMAWRSGSRKSMLLAALAAGATGGAATLIRPSWLLFTPLAIAAALAFDSRRRQQLFIALPMCASFVLVMSPWWIRNWHVTGHFVPTSLQIGASLYDGLNPNADGSSNLDFVPRFAAEEHEHDAAQGGLATFEYRLNRRLRVAAIDWAKAHPGEVVRLAGVKFLRTWNIWPNEPAFRSWTMRCIVLVTYTPLLCLGLFGAWRFSRFGWPYVLAWLPAIYFTLLHIVFVGSLRYREPAMLALAVLAAGILAASKPRPADKATALIHPCI